mmetsp:Transcript_52934/g.61115  ORF Transcript_52934/g.61115 Transcript_52934/m.61115 type:complete len:138 (+) Transcript_52934:721-1134(+)
MSTPPPMTLITTTAAHGRTTGPISPTPSLAWASPRPPLSWRRTPTPGIPISAPCCRPTQRTLTPCRRRMRPAGSKTGQEVFCRCLHLCALRRPPEETPARDEPGPVEDQHGVDRAAWPRACPGRSLQRFQDQRARRR